MPELPSNHMPEIGAANTSEPSSRFDIFLKGARYKTRSSLGKKTEEYIKETKRLEFYYDNMWLKFSQRETQIVYPIATHKLRLLADLNQAYGDDRGSAFGQIRHILQLDLLDRDIMTFSVADQLGKLVGSELLKYPVRLKQATRAIGTLLATSLYKLYERGQTAPLGAALSLVDTYTQFQPRFHPGQVDYNDVRTSLLRAGGALNAHHLNRPDAANDPYSTHLLTQVLAGLDQTDVIYTHLNLRSNR